MTTSRRHSPRRVSLLGGRHLAVPLAVLLLVTMAACATMPPDRIAYNSIEGAVIGVQSAVKVWGSLGPHSDAEVAKVKAAYEKFQAGTRLAIAIAEAATNKEQKATALSIVNAAAGDLFALLRELGVK